MALKVGELFATLNVKDDGFNKSMNSAMSSFTKLAAKAISTIATINTLKMGVNYNAGIEQLQTSFEVMTGSAEKAVDVMDKIRTLGASTPFEMEGLASTTQLLMNYGLTADDAIASMTQLGDIAQGDQDKLSRIATAFGQMSSAGKVQLEDIKQMIEAGYNPLQEISQSTGESMASLYDRISKGKVSVDEITASMKRSTSQGGKYFRSMEKQSKTLNGRMSTLKDTAMQLLGSAVQPINQVLADNILPMATGIIENVQAEFDRGGFVGVGKMLMDKIGYNIIKARFNLKKRLAGVDWGALITDVITFKTGGGAAKIINAASEFLSGINWEDVKLTLSGVGENVVSAISAAITAAKNGSITLITAVGDLLTKAFSKENLKAATDTLLAAGAGILTAIVAGINTGAGASAEILTAFTDMLNSVDWGGAAYTLTTFVGDLIREIATAIGNVNFAEVMEAIGTALAAAVAGLHSVCEGIAIAICEFIVNADTWIALGKAILSIIGGVFSGVMSYLQNRFKWLMDKLDIWSSDIESALTGGIMPDIGIEINPEIYTNEGRIDENVRAELNGIINAINSGFSESEIHSELLVDMTTRLAEDGYTAKQIEQVRNEAERIIAAYFSSDTLTASAAIDVAVTPSVVDDSDDIGKIVETAVQDAASSFAVDAAPTVTLDSTSLATLSEDTKAEVGQIGTDAATAFADNLVAGIGNASGSVDTAIASVTAALKTSLSGISTSAFSSGHNLAKGLANGITAGRTAVTNAARALANAAISTVNSTLRIKSPSRVMMQSGEYTGEGFALGMNSTLSMVSKSASALASMAASKTTARSPAAGLARSTVHTSSTTSAEFDYDRMGQVISAIKVVMDVDGKRMAESQSRNNSTAMAMYKQRVARGYGY